MLKHAINTRFATIFFLIIIMQSIIQFRMKRLRVFECSYRIHLLILIGPHVKTWTNGLNPPQIVLPTKSLTKAIISLLEAIKSILRKIKNFSFQNVTQQKQPKHVVSLMTIYLCVSQMFSFYLQRAIKRILFFLHRIWHEIHPHIISHSAGKTKSIVK